MRAIMLLHPQQLAGLHLIPEISSQIEASRIPTHWSLREKGEEALLMHAPSKLAVRATSDSSNGLQRRRNQTNSPDGQPNMMADGSLCAICKRAIDITGTVFGLLVLFPVIVGSALGIKLTSRGPVFYRQTRIGKSGRSFGCLKFRTMTVGAHAQQDQLRIANEQDGPAFKILDDPRVTPFGRLLRKFSIDELPQLLNVLIGDMSLVGPRPPTPSEVEQYTWWQHRRLSVKPGLTCIWQVYGRNRVSFKRWVEMDLYYIDNWTLWMDVKLIIHTIRVVLCGSGM